MYALPNKTQHKLIAKVRGGISQKLDNLTSATNSANINQNSVSSLAIGRPGSLTTLGSKHQLFDEAGFNAEINNWPRPIFSAAQEKKTNLGNKSKSSSRSQQQKHLITPEHNEMIKFVQQTWQGAVDLNNDRHGKSKHANSKKKPATSSTPLLLSGPYHHTSSNTDGSTSKESFQPFDLEAFWENRILKKLTQDI